MNIFRFAQVELNEETMRRLQIRVAQAFQRLGASEVTVILHSKRNSTCSTFNYTHTYTSTTRTCIHF